MRRLQASLEMRCRGPTPRLSERSATESAIRLEDELPFDKFDAHDFLMILSRSSRGLNHENYQVDVGNNDVAGGRSHSS